MILTIEQIKFLKFEGYKIEKTKFNFTDTIILIEDKVYKINTTVFNLRCLIQHYIELEYIKTL